MWTIIFYILMIQEFAMEVKPNKDFIFIVSMIMIVAFACSFGSGALLGKISNPSSDQQSLNHEEAW